MPVYLWQASYRPSGVAGLLKDGGTKRRAVVQQMVEKAGGRLIAMYYAFGESDVFGIVEFPDQATAAAVSLTVAASGAVGIKTTVLLTPEEVDAAARKSVNYQAPGT